MSERDPLNMVGQVLADKYRVDALVGEGGFAVVYRAQQLIWNKPVAIKFFSGLSSAPPDQRDALAEAFVQEGALLTELSTQTVNIVQARDVGTYTAPDGRWVPYMVLEWLEGDALEDLLAREKRMGKASWSLEDTLALVGQAAQALDVAHKRGVAHRDIKPANLFIVREGDSQRVKVLDFGVAKMMADNTQIKAAFAKTGTNITSFTPQYGAPEQFDRRHGATGPWTDVYALALVATELLSGKLCLDGDDLVQLGFASANPERRPTPRALGAEVPDAVEAVFRKALAVAPTERHESAGEFWAALQAAMNGDVSSTLLHPMPVSRADIGTDATQLMPSRPTDVKNTVDSAQAITASASSGSRPGVLLGALGAFAAVAGVAYFATRSGPGESSDSSPPNESNRAAAQQSAAPPTSAPAAPAPTCPQDMASIPAGQYFMGSDDQAARDNEKPSHNVTLSAFCIDLHEVTAKQYKACSDVGKCKRARQQVVWPEISKTDEKAYAPLCTIDDEEREDHPINCVTWEMASTYCTANDKRLPTEAEWEYATRGPDGRVYPWGDEEPTAEHLNACGSECLKWAKEHGVRAQFPGALYEADDGYPTTAPVGSFPKGRSRFGPFDVVGNVWEWVADWDGPYEKTPRNNPSGPASGEKRVIRGGAWNGSFASWLRPSFRYAQEPSARSHGIGFRCARPLEPEKQ